MTDRRSRASSDLFQGRAVYLLCSLLLLLGMAPLVGEGAWGRRLLDVVFTILLLAAVFEVSELRRQRVLALCLAVPSILVRWSKEIMSSDPLGPAGFVLTAGFLIYVAVLMLGKVMRARRITGDTVATALCVYLLLGVIWASAYAFAYVLEPETAFAFPTGESDSGHMKMRELIYFSFVTLTTLGYGDITPRANWARSLAILEAVIGQIFIAVLLARLVALQIVHAAGGGDD